MATSTAALHWYIPLEKLDSRQKEFIDLYRQPAAQNIFLQGPPGSGKTILLVNIINQLRTQNPGQRIGLVTYTRSLIDMLNTGLAAGGGAMTYHEFMKSTTRYDVLVVDEVQDLPSNVLFQIRSSATRVIVAGDTHQRIFRDGCDQAAILGALNLNGEQQMFRIATTYRLTPSVFRAARVFKPQVQEARESTSKTDVKPELARAQTIHQEIEYIYKRARLGPQNGQMSAILLRTQQEIVAFANAVLAYEGKPQWGMQTNRYSKTHFGSLNQHLQQQGIPLEVVQNNYGSLSSAVQNKRIVLQTYHSAKGLDYNNVYLPFLNASSHIGDFEPETLFYVALTRSRAILCLSYTGTPHAYVSRIAAHCAGIEADPRRIQAVGATVNFGDDF